MAMATPWSQGSLDHLCGAYAIINAVRHAAPAPGLTRSDSCALLTELILQMDDHASVARAIGWGMSRRMVGQALRATAAWLDDWHGWRLDVRWPFYRVCDIAPDAVLARVRAHLRDPNRAAILAFGGEMDHWTVVTAVERERVLLFDSTRRRFVRRRSIGAQGDDTRRYPLWPASTVFIAIADAP